VRVLVDANVLVSALLVGSNTNKPIAQTFRFGGLGLFDVLIAEESIVEVRSTLASKPWFVRNIPFVVGESFLEHTIALAPVLPALAYLPPRRCRDRRDDYLLEQAVRFGADVLLTGDRDLLSIEHPPAGLRILDPRAFVDEFSQPE